MDKRTQAVEWAVQAIAEDIANRGALGKVWPLLHQSARDAAMDAWTEIIDIMLCQVRDWNE